MVFPINPGIGDVCTINDTVYKWDGVVWDVLASAGLAAPTVYTLVAADGQTDFDVVYKSKDFVDVFVNGIKLTSNQFTASNGSKIVLGTALTSSDTIEIRVSDGVVLAETIKQVIATSLVSGSVPTTSYKNGVLEIGIPTGPIGKTGDKGDTGAVGKSAYDHAIELGFVGTEAAWLASLKGEVGQGLTPKGTKTVLEIMSLTDMVDGDFWIASDTFDGYVYSNGWINIGNIKGPKGDAGKSVFTLAVESGFTGTLSEWLESLKVKGDKGDKGDQGIQGIQGEQGIQGIQGLVGPAGKDGVSVSSVSGRVSGSSLFLDVNLSNGNTQTVELPYNDSSAEVEQLRKKLKQIQFGIV